MYIIIKNIEQPNGKVLPVVILDSNSEVWEFDTQFEAEKIREIFEKNSDSGHKYEVKKI
jgi:hypothetical protein